MPISNYHTHIYLCRHASGKVSDYVEKAILNNYEEIVISDHGPLPEELRSKLHSARMREDEFTNIYLKELQTTREGFKDQIKVLFGTEIEYLPETKNLLPFFKENLDYLILGQHYYIKNNHYYSVFGDNKYNPREIKIFSEDLFIYANTISEALNTGYFKILAHPEIIMIVYPRWDNNTEAAMRIIIEACIRNNVYLEFNANGLRRGNYELYPGYKYDKLYMYPRFEFWDLLYKEYNYDRVIISDDSHSLKDFNDEATKWSYDYFKEHNYPFKEKIEL